MKVFISAAIEAITGVIHFHEVLPEKEEHKHARELMLGDVNAGAWFAAELKNAGYDGIILKGKSANLFTFICNIFE